MDQKLGVESEEGWVGAEKGKLVSWTSDWRKGRPNDPVSLFKDPWGRLWGKGSRVQPSVLNPIRLMGLASDLSTPFSLASSGFQMWTW